MKDLAREKGVSLGHIDARRHRDGAERSRRKGPFSFDTLLATGQGSRGGAGGSGSGSGGDGLSCVSFCAWDGLSQVGGCLPPMVWTQPLRNAYPSALAVPWLPGKSCRGTDSE